MKVVENYALDRGSATRTNSNGTWAKSTVPPPTPRPVEWTEVDFAVGESSRNLRLTGLRTLSVIAEIYRPLGICRDGLVKGRDVIES